MNNWKKMQYSWYYNSDKKSFDFIVGFSRPESDVNYFDFFRRDIEVRQKAFVN